MSKQNDWKQLARDDLEEYERRQNAKPRWHQNAISAMVVVGVILFAALVAYLRIEFDKVYMGWQINR